MITNVTEVNYKSYDYFGIAASLLCGVHCALSPLIILLAPTFSTLWSSTSVHIAAALFVVPLAAFALSRGYQRHRRLLPPVLGIIGCLFILLALLPIWTGLPPLAYVSGSGFAMNAQHLTDEHAGCCPMISENGQGATVLSLPWPTMLTFLGSILLLSGHIKNCSACRCSTTRCVG